MHVAPAKNGHSARMRVASEGKCEKLRADLSLIIRFEIGGNAFFNLEMRERRVNMSTSPGRRQKLMIPT